MRNINSLEKAILNEIIEYNRYRFPDLSTHLEYIKVEYFQVTGVGMYIYFCYAIPNLRLYLDTKNIVIASDKMLMINTLDFCLNYQLSITDGKLHFLELVTNGEAWYGEYESFSFVKSTKPSKE